MLPLISRHPADRLAFAWQDGSSTYGRLRELAQAALGVLALRGVHRGSAVGIVGRQAHPLRHGFSRVPMRVASPFPSPATPPSTPRASR